MVARTAQESMPSELRKLGKTITYWFEKIMAFHEIRITNGPTEGLNNLIKRVKRVAFGFTNFDNYRIRALLYAGKPNWRVLDSIVVT
ncbi:MAG: transposase [Acidimicrobiales bacterium]